jgi:hypothetical protein
MSRHIGALATVLNDMPRMARLGRMSRHIGALATVL